MALALASFWDLLTIMEGDAFYLHRARSKSVSRGGTIRQSTSGPERWKATVSLRPAEHATSIGAEVDIGQLRGVGEFEAYDPRRAYPLADPTGSILGAASVVIASVGVDNRSLALSGLPAGYVLTKGDYLSYPRSGGRLAYVRLMESVTASGLGVTAEFDVEPFLPSGTVTGAAVTLKKGRGQFIITPGSLVFPRAQHVISSGIQFAIEESR